MILNRIEDVNMPNPRLGVGAPVGTGALITIGDLRALNTACGAIITPGTKIRGTVISDRTTLNINGQNLILQDGTSGVIVRFLGTNTFNLNDSIEINLSGDSLITYQGGIEVNYVPNANATFLGTGTVVPRVVTAAYLLSNLPLFESTLIKVTGATLSGTGNFGGSVNVTDATGTVIMYTRTGASFASTPYPTGTVSVTGFISNYYGVPEIIIRGTTDVQ